MPLQSLSLVGHRHLKLLTPRFCCYFIPFVSQVLLGHSFHPVQQLYHTSSLLSAPRNDLEQLTVIQLKDQLRTQGLKVSGRKAELIDRLLETKNNNNDDDDDSTELTTMARTTRNIKDEEKSKSENEENATSPRKRARKNKTSDSEEPEKKKKSPTKKKKAADHQRITERDEIPKLWDSEKALKDGSYTFKIASWNVAGLRALLKKQPDALRNILKEYDLDMLCLQETKLQEMHLEDNKKTKVPAAREMLKEDGYSEYWSFSTEKKGYSGTAVFIKEQGGKKAKQQSIGNFFAPKSANSKTEGKKKAASKSSATLALPVSSDTLTPKNISYKIGKEIDNEGRTITVEFPWATLTNVYVPNAGQDLKRLEYRTSSWDKDFFEFQKKKEADRKLPVIWLGDLNIAHKPFDVWNNGASHLVKQAGVTPQERASFQEQLDTGFVDAFRRLHPDAKGNYSYWSQRAGNRVPNKGLRLDYFICSPELFEDDSKVVVRDSYMLKDCLGSDHCPVVLELEIKP